MWPTVKLFADGAAKPASNPTVIVEFLVVDDDAAFNRLGELVADLVQAPTTMPWEVARCCFATPKGTSSTSSRRPLRPGGSGSDGPPSLAGERVGGYSTTRVPVLCVARKEKRVVASEIRTTFVGIPRLSWQLPSLRGPSTCRSGMLTSSQLESATPS